MEIDPLKTHKSIIIEALQTIEDTNPSGVYNVHIRNLSMKGMEANGLR